MFITLPLWAHPLFKMIYISDMLVSVLQMDKLEKARGLLQKYESALKEQEEHMAIENAVFSLEQHKKLINTFYAELYIRKGDMDKAGVYIHKAGEYDCKGSDAPFADYTYDKTLALYKEMLALNTAASNEAFDRQMSQLRQLNDIDDREERAHKLASQTEHLALQQYRLIASGIFLFISLALIYVLTLYYRRVRRLKNDLLNERASLIESEKQLREMTDLAEIANRMKTTFISNISHEVRTPLNVIVGFSELLLDDSYDDETKKDFAQTISKNTELLLNLVNDVLDLSRLESGKIQFSIKPVEIVSCCREAMDSSIGRVSPNVRLLFSPTVDAYTVNTDRFRILQLLSNLLSNAAKFTREGEIELVVDVDEKKCQMRLILTDTGCGIKPEQQVKIFEHFEKLDEFAQGTGLGLPICKIIAQRLSGSLFVDPAYTAGARFVFVHPLNLV